MKRADDPEKIVTSPLSNDDVLDGVARLIEENRKFKLALDRIGRHRLLSELGPRVDSETILSDYNVMIEEARGILTTLATTDEVHPENKDTRQKIGLSSLRYAARKIVFLLENLPPGKNSVRVSDHDLRALLGREKFRGILRNKIINELILFGCNVVDEGGCLVVKLVRSEEAFSLTQARGS